MREVQSRKAEDKTNPRLFRLEGDRRTKPQFVTLTVEKAADVESPIGLHLVRDDDSAGASSLLGSRRVINGQGDARIWGVSRRCPIGFEHQDHRIQPPTNLFLTLKRRRQTQLLAVKPMGAIQISDREGNDLDPLQAKGWQCIEHSLTLRDSAARP